MLLASSPEVSSPLSFPTLSLFCPPNLPRQHGKDSDDDERARERDDNRTACALAAGLLGMHKRSQGGRNGEGCEWSDASYNGRWTWAAN